MKSYVWIVALGALVACGADGARKASAKIEWHAAETNGAGTPATWRRLSDSGSDDASVVECASSNSGQTYNLYLSDAVLGPDVELRVGLRANSGAEDQGGGLVWRAVDASNYYIARWNPLEDNFRLYKVANGERTQLASATAALAPGDWHELYVSMTGTSMTVRLDWAIRLQFDDATFTDAGKIGLWTKADASTSFGLPSVKVLER